MNTYKNSTAEQAVIVSNYNKLIVDFLTKFKALQRRAEAAVVSLPAINEQGEAVVHGCNKVMHQIHDNYVVTVHNLGPSVEEFIGDGYKTER